MKALTGQTPLNIVLIHPRRAIIYWDVTDPDKKIRILRALEAPGFFRFPAEEGSVADHNILRAYKAGYFKLLRQAVLLGRSAHSVEWILNEAEAFWRKSADKVRRHIWLRRIALDRKALAEGVEVAAGVMPRLDPNLTATDRTTPLDETPRVSSQKWICDLIYLLRDQKETQRRKEAEESATKGGADKMEAG